MSAKSQQTVFRICLVVVIFALAVFCFVIGLDKVINPHEEYDSGTWFDLLTGALLLVVSLVLLTIAGLCGKSGRSPS